MSFVAVSLWIWGQRSRQWIWFPESRLIVLLYSVCRSRMWRSSVWAGCDLFLWPFVFNLIDLSITHESSCACCSGFSLGSLTALAAQSVWACFLSCLLAGSGVLGVQFCAFFIRLGLDSGQLQSFIAAVAVLWSGIIVLGSVWYVYPAWSLFLACWPSLDNVKKEFSPFFLWVLLLDWWGKRAWLL